MDNIQEQNSELSSFDQLMAPKWLSVIFKIYSILVLITGIFGVVMISMLFSAEPLTFLISISLIILGTVLSSFILAYGCWKLKRWVIPILALTAISGLLYFFQDSSIQSIGSSIVSIIFFVIAIYYRRYFMGHYRSYSMQGFYILGLILIVAASIFPIFTGSLGGARAGLQTAYSLHDIRQYSLGLELYYSDNSQYPENLNTLESSGYVFPQTIDSISNTNRKINYCITNDKQNYAIGAPVSDSFGNIMEESVDQADLSCDLSTDKICGENGYYCEVGIVPIVTDRADGWQAYGDSHFSIYYPKDYDFVFNLCLKDCVSHSTDGISGLSVEIEAESEDFGCFFGLCRESVEDLQTYNGVIWDYLGLQSHSDIGGSRSFYAYRTVYEGYAYHVLFNKDLPINEKIMKTFKFGSAKLSDIVFLLPKSGDVLEQGLWHEVRLSRAVGFWPGDTRGKLILIREDGSFVEEALNDFSDPVVGMTAKDVGRYKLRLVTNDYNQKVLAESGVFIVAEDQDAYTLSAINQYGTGLEIYYVYNDIYPESLEILESSGHIYLSPETSASDNGKKINYCITNDKQNYAIGAPVSDSFGNIMEESVDQADLSCDLSTDKICGENGYYCEVGFMSSPSGGVATADIEEIGMTFEYPSYWGDVNYQIKQGWEGAGFSVYIFFSNFDRVSLGGNSRDYSYPGGATMFDFSGLDETNPSEFVTSQQSCEGSAPNIKHSDSVFINLLGCKNININEGGLSSKAFDYFITYNWTNEPDKVFRPGLHRIVESNIPNNVGGLRIIFDLDTPVYPIEELRLSIEKPENLIENKSEILDFYEEVVYGLQLEVADKNLLQLNNEFTDLVSSIKFR